MSVEYYAKLERGSLAGASAGVLDAIAWALQLDDAERAHLLHLAHEADGSNAVLRRRPKPEAIRPSLQWTLDTITTAPAIVGNNRLDFLAANHLGRAMYSDLLLDPATPELRHYLPRRCRPPVLPGLGPRGGHVRGEPAHRRREGPHDKGLRPRRRALHPQRRVPPPLGSPQRPHHGSGVKHFHHHVVGDLTLALKASTCAANPASP